MQRIARSESLRPCVLLLVLAMGACRHTTGLRQALTNVEQLSELDVSFSYDASSGFAALGSESGAQGIFLVPIRGERRQIDVEGYWPRKPILSRGAEWIAYQALEPTRQVWNRGLYVWNLRKAGVFHHLTLGDSAGYIGHPSFSPDARQLVYEIAIDERNELRLIDLDTFKERVLVGEGAPRAPEWAPSGQTIYFVRKQSAETCLSSIDLAAAQPRTIVCIPGEHVSDNLAVSPNGARVALAVEHDGCNRIAIVDVRSPPEAISGTGGPTWLAEGGLGCSTGPAWTSDDELAYVHQPLNATRVPRIKTLAGPPRSLGIETGVTYAVAGDGHGGVLALTGLSTVPRSLWAIDPSRPNERRLLHSPAEASFLETLGRLNRPPRQVMVRSADGLSIPVMVFPRCCSDGPGPAVLWVHGGGNGAEDVSPNYYYEFEYLTLIGVSVIAPNYRGSTGYGTDYRLKGSDQGGQLADVLATVRALPSIPEVDPKQVMISGGCAGAQLAAKALMTEPDAFRGAIQWLANADSWTEAAPILQRIPFLWVNGRGDPAIEQYRRTAEILERSHVQTEWHRVPEKAPYGEHSTGWGHIWLSVTAREEALQLLHRFARSHLEGVADQ